jgi:hypothetical protein
LKILDPERSHLIRNPDVLLKEEDEDGALVFNPDTDKILVLNPTGLFIWNRCDGNIRLEDLVTSVRRSFSSVPEEQVGGDVRGFVEKMIAEGFIGVMEEPAGC